MKIILCLIMLSYGVKHYMIMTVTKPWLLILKIGNRKGTENAILWSFFHLCSFHMIFIKLI